MSDSDHSPIIRLHLWLDTPDGVFFGSGRAQLLQLIERHGSIKKAAEELGMSYRAAWGKIRKSEEVLGFKLVERDECRRDGCRLTEFGRLLVDSFTRWFEAVETAALEKAVEIFPWRSRSYQEANLARKGDASPRPGVASD